MNEPGPSSLPHLLIVKSYCVSDLRYAMEREMMNAKRVAEDKCVYVG